MYAIVRTGGKQYRVEEGRTVTVERLPAEEGAPVELGDVLLIADDGEVTVGTPTIEGARVLAQVETHGRGKKLIVFKYKAKVRTRKKTGHRQAFTRLTVQEILRPGQESKEAAKPKRARRRKKAEEAPEAPAAAEAEAPEPPVAEAEAPPAEAPPTTRRRTRRAAPAEGEAPKRRTRRTATAGEEPPKPRARRKSAEEPAASAGEEEPKPKTPRGRSKRPKTETTEETE